MAKQLSEEELNIRRTARRRLIGAVALALAVVVFLPMVLDREPKPDGQDIDLTIPDPAKSGEFVPGAAPSAVNEMTSLDDPASEVSAGDAASAVPAPLADKPAAPEKSAASEKPAALAKPATPDKPGVAAKPANAAPAQSAKPTDAKPGDTKSANAAAKPTAPAAKPAAKAAAASGGFVVQVGAFSNVVTANGEVDKLKVWGFTAYTEQVGSATRVRLGPYAERGQADEVRRALEGHGLHPVVTALK